MLTNYTYTHTHTHRNKLRIITANESIELGDPFQFGVSAGSEKGAPEEEEEAEATTKMFGYLIDWAPTLHIGLPIQPFFSLSLSSSTPSQHNVRAHIAISRTPKPTYPDCLKHTH